MVHTRLPAVFLLAVLASQAQPVLAAQGSVCPDNFAVFDETAEPLACTCSADATERGSVRGMDIYAGDSSICRAALHAGVIDKRGGPVTVIAEPGRKAYPGVTRNGVTSQNAGRTGHSFRFAEDAQALADRGFAVQPASDSPCPTNFVAFAETTDPLACTCSDEATEGGSVWGMDIYTADSAVCRAALHAGVIDKRGGPVTVFPEAGQRSYPNVTRNGVTSSNYGRYEHSFRFTSTTPQITGDEPCPNNFLAFADGVDPLACTCSEEATESGPVYGMDIYTVDSSICRAALHAGAIDKRGGKITVFPEQGQKIYPGVKRNGVTSSGYGRYDHSFRFTAETPQPSSDSPCPNNFSVYADTTDPVTCTCSEEATESGSVWGMDVYTNDSALCRAALHAGVIDRRGGIVTVLPEPGRSGYPGATRNGVTSSNYGRYDHSFSFAPETRGTAVAPPENSEPSAAINRGSAGGRSLDPAPVQNGSQ